MGGRGSSSSSSQQWSRTPSPRQVRQVQAQTQAAGGGNQAQQQMQQPQQAPQAQQPQFPTNTPVAPNPVDYHQLKGMPDVDVANIVLDSVGVDMPNHLSDRRDSTQEFVYSIGMNSTPTVLDAQQFAQYVKANNIPSNTILGRVSGGGTFTTTSGTQRKLTADQVVQMWASDPYTYISGKHGGQVYGAGQYFDMNGGRHTGYGGSNLTRAVLNPKTAKPIGYAQLSREWSSYSKTHPKTAKAVSMLKNGNTDSVKALILGYNVITSSSSGSGKSFNQRGEYHNVIDRSAVVITF